MGFSSELTSEFCFSSEKKPPTHCERLARHPKQHLFDSSACRNLVVVLVSLSSLLTQGLAPSLGWTCKNLNSLAWLLLPALLRLFAYKVSDLGLHLHKLLAASGKQFLNLLKAGLACALPGTGIEKIEKPWGLALCPVF